MADAISAVGMADYDEVFSFADAYCVNELVLYPGDVGVENYFGFTAKVFYCVEHEFFIVKD